MVVAVPEGLGVLQALAENDPSLAPRVEALVGRLMRIEPLASEPLLRLAADELEQLVQYFGRGADGATDDAAALSADAHDVLRRAAIGNGPPPWVIGNGVVRLAHLLGRAFEPRPAELLGIYRQVEEAERDFAAQLAWLASCRGGDLLVDGLAQALAEDVPLVLDFLDAAVAAHAEGPMRGAAPAPARSAPSAPRSVERMRERHVRETAFEMMSDALYAVRDVFGQIRKRRAEPSRPEPPEPPAPVVVSTGFAPARDAPGLSPRQTLAAGRRYEFFVEIARELTPDAVDTSATPLPPLPEGTVLQVVLFGFADGLVPFAGSESGELRLLGDGTAVVEGDPGRRRLHLTVETPAEPGTARMRCNVYCRQVLLQSRLVEAVVTETERTTAERAITSTLDFAVVSDLLPEHLNGLQDRTLSILANDDGNGTHGFRFFAGTSFVENATITAGQLEDALDETRTGLRLASWNKAHEPTLAEFAQSHVRYRYAVPNADVLREDLSRLAIRGLNAWDVLVNELSGDRVDELVERMQAPGVVEIANRAGLDLLIPAACLYDYPIDANADHRVCPAFLAAAAAAAPLESTDCFQGRCPSYGIETVVCPSGFWGFRHEIGFVVSLTDDRDSDELADEADDAVGENEPGSDPVRNQALTITAGSGLVFTVGSSTDSALTERVTHLADLQAALGGEWHLSESLAALKADFKKVQPSVVYLYGHGGRAGRKVFFAVGSGLDGPLQRSTLQWTTRSWKTRPLVFLNGCGSAALAPDAAFSYATGFLTTAHASAVVGAEIAVFEKLAVPFANDCLHRFVVERKPLGKAVRETRLALLKQGNPLGLAYLAFGPSELRIV